MFLCCKLFGAMQFPSAINNCYSLFSFLSDWYCECCSSLGEELKAGAGFLAADWPLAGCTSGCWLLPQNSPQELQRSQTGECNKGDVSQSYKIMQLRKWIFKIRDMNGLIRWIDSLVKLFSWPVVLKLWHNCGATSDKIYETVKYCVNF